MPMAPEQRVFGTNHLKQREVVASVKPLLEEILASGFYLDEQHYQLILRLAGE